ncbi:MAG: rhodanese-like domain-containing protein [Gemmatimonadaceae bacterium]
METMIFKRFYDENLAQATYLVGCEKSREALLVDPNLDTARYLRAAGSERLRISHVTETHIHADFVSGSYAVADATGATLHLSGESDANWGYVAGATRSASWLRDGDQIEFGNICVRALHTPGHTPEHLSFLVADLERGRQAVGVLTGDFVFVGDVGRPDLLELAAGAKGSMRDSAAQLFRSVQTFKRQPDYLQVWPGHGAGSACGKALGAMPQSTVGYEKLFNWAFAPMSEQEFIERVLTDQPVPPRYFAVMKELNRHDELPARRAGEVRRLGLSELEAAVTEGTLIDTRRAERFAEGHIPGSLSVPLNESFLNWCGSLVSYEKDFYLMSDAESDEAIHQVIAELAKIGLVRASGFFGPEVLREWKSGRGPLEKVTQLIPGELHSLSNKQRVQVIDVRSPDEWRRGHLADAINIPLAALPGRLSEIDSAIPVVFHCKGGGRSSIATSFLLAAGKKDASNLQGGYDSWKADGFEVITGPP